MSLPPSEYITSRIFSALSQPYPTQQIDNIFTQHSQYDYTQCQYRRGRLNRHRGSSVNIGVEMQLEVDNSNHINSQDGYIEGNTIIHHWVMANQPQLITKWGQFIESSGKGKQGTEGHNSHKKDDNSNEPNFNINMDTQTAHNPSLPFIPLHPNYLNRRNNDGQTAIHLAIRLGSYKLIRTLANIKTVNINAYTNDGQKLIQVAARQNQLEATLELGLNLRDTDYYGRNALHSAAQYNSVKFVEYLLAVTGGQLIDVQDNNGDTPLHLAVFYGNTKVVKMLLLAGANRHILNGQQQLPIHIANAQAFENIAFMLDEDYSSVDKLKICYNMRMKYEPTQRSYGRVFVVAAIYAFLFWLTAFGIKFVDDAWKWGQIGFYILIGLLYFRLVVGGAWQIRKVKKVERLRRTAIQDSSGFNNESDGAMNRHSNKKRGLNKLISQNDNDSQSSSYNLETSLLSSQTDKSKIIESDKTDGTLRTNDPMSNNLSSTPYPNNSYPTPTIFNPPPSNLPYLSLICSHKLQECCLHCIGPLPPRGYHCLICNRCITRYDHHCPLINGCVGNQNLASYLMFLITVVICLLWEIFLGLNLILPEISNKYASTSIATASDWNIIIAMLLLVLSLIIMFPIIMLLVRQLNNIGRGLTEYQRAVRGKKGQGNIKWSVHNCWNMVTAKE